MKRHKMSRGHSKRQFRNSAGPGSVHPRNNAGGHGPSMRGGIRL